MKLFINIKVFAIITHGDVVVSKIFDCTVFLVGIIICYDVIIFGGIKVIITLNGVVTSMFNAIPIICLNSILRLV